MRRWRGTLVVEGVQTGDGRVIAAGALSWADLPLPFAWLRDGDQHINLTEVAPQVGVIETITRGEGGAIDATGLLDDDNPDGAELARRMDAGTASNGTRQLVSIDPDDWAVEIIAMDPDDSGEGDVLLAARGRGRVPLRAAAGDPDPEGEGVLLLSDSSDSVIERYTRMRIRGVTACAVSAFTEAFIELEPADAAAPAEPDPEADPDAEPAVTAASLSTGVGATTANGGSRPAVQLLAPRAAFFLPEPEPGAEDDGSVYGMPVQELLVEQPDGGLAVPFTVVERDGWRWCFGHAARFGQCHVGYPGCVTAPESATSYAHFHHGHVLVEGGERVATGPLTVSTDHADAWLFAPDARDHYANTGLAFADVRASNGGLGVWVSGLVRAGVTDQQLAVVRASSLSGDWRDTGDPDLEFIGALAVNVPGFPIARQLAAAAGVALQPALTAATTGMVDGRQRSLVAAGVVQRCAECAQRAAASQADDRLDQVLAIVQRLDLRTRGLRDDAARHALHAIRG